LTTNRRLRCTSSRAWLVAAVVVSGAVIGVCAATGASGDRFMALQGSAIADILVLRWLIDEPPRRHWVRVVCALLGVAGIVIGLWRLLDTRDAVAAIVSIVGGAVFVAGVLAGRWRHDTRGDHRGPPHEDRG
jgi:hypothetical protein